MALRLSRDPLPLRSAHIDGGVQLRLRHQYRFVEDSEQPASGRWHVSTVAYHYRLSRADSTELLSWHWHPQTGLPTPHLHAAVDGIGRRAHLPTGRVSIESVVRLLLADLGVTPRRSDWQDVLDAAEGPFIRYRRWS